MLVSNEGGIVVCFSLRERFFIRPNVVFVGFIIDGEARSFIEPLEAVTISLQGAEFNGELGGRIDK